MKTISIIVPTYNEEGNVVLMYDRVTQLFKEKLSKYTYELIYIDNCSHDHTRDEIMALCKNDKQVKAVFNAKNFGFVRSTFYGLLQGSGDCSVLIYADMQDPPEVIETFVEKWEQGYKTVIGKKRNSNENKLMYLIRTIYYKIIKRIVDIEHIEHYNGFGLYDKEIIEMLKDVEDSYPYLRGLISELGYDMAEVLYDQKVRVNGKSNFNFYKLYDVAMLGITSYSKSFLRIFTFLGAIICVISFLIAIVTTILKLLHVIDYPIGNAALLFGVYFLGAINLFFLGIIGEYVLSINTRSMKRPLVIEKRRINFDE